MLAPRLSVRALFGLVVLTGFASLVVAQAIRGAPWAGALVMAGVTLGTMVLLYAVAFLVVWVMAGPGRDPLGPRQGTPFATSEPPPQILPPEEPELN